MTNDSAKARVSARRSTRRYNRQEQKVDASYIGDRHWLSGFYKHKHYSIDPTESLYPVCVCVYNILPRLYAENSEKAKMDSTPTASLFIVFERCIPCILGYMEFFILRKSGILSFFFYKPCNRVYEAIRKIAISACTYRAYEI